MTESHPQSFPLLDTHTGGEITRVVIGEAIGLPAGTVADQLAGLRGGLDWVRRSLTAEPRGSAFAVGAVVGRPQSRPAPWTVVFFNNVGYLGMCGHGLLGVVEALRHRAEIGPGTHRFATPAGVVSAGLNAAGDVTFTGVHSWCERQDVRVDCDDGTSVIGDIAYGGNWFFLARDDDVATATTEHLTERCRRIRTAINDQGIRGASGAEVDHIELFCTLDESPPSAAIEISGGTRNFVLCPGGHYDRSPCGTGTSAKLATLAAKGKLRPGQHWVQQSVTGSRFLASYQDDGDGVRVTIRGRAHVIAETIQIYDLTDRLRFGTGVTP